jgi:hypothetical protein
MPLVKLPDILASRIGVIRRRLLLHSVLAAVYASHRRETELLTMPRSVAVGENCIDSVTNLECDSVRLAVSRFLSDCDGLRKS